MPRSRILYGVQGEGRGHATRSLRVLQALIHEGHDVLVLTGGDALPLLSAALGNRVVEVPLLRYHYNARGGLCLWRTVVRNLAPFARIAFRDPGLDAVLRRFRPEAAVSDFEPVTCRFAHTFRLPLLAVDHQHFLTETMLPRLRGLPNALKLFAYRAGTNILSGWPKRLIVSSFHHFPRRPGSRASFVGPFLSEDIAGLAVRDLGHVSVYLKRPHYLSRLLPVLARFPRRSFEVFSAWEKDPPEAMPENVHLHSLSRAGFLESLASAHALITTAGNQVLGEAIWLGKPALALPEPGVLEQEFNARALEQSGCGTGCGFEAFTAEVWEAFEARRSLFARAIEALKGRNPHYDGLETTLRSIRRLAGAAERKSKPVAVTA